MRARTQAVHVCRALAAVAAFVQVPAGGAAWARTWRITPDQTGDAPTIQAGIDSAQAGDVVLLAPGTYSWSSQGAAGASMLRLVRGITLRGEAGAAATVLDGELQGRLLVCADVGDGLVLEDLTLQNGFAPPEGDGAARAPLASADSHGGAMDVRGMSSPTVRRCVFRGNRASGGTASGAAVYCDVASFADCEFIDNMAGLGGPTNGRGGAVWCGAALFERCVFRGNRAWGFEAASGGAVRSTSASFVDCRFESNSIECPGGPRGGALFDGGAPSLRRCEFRDNRADGHYFFASGGAVEAGSGTLVECLFVGNVAACSREPAQGGGVAGAELDIEACVFIANEALRTSPPGPGAGGAIYGRFQSTVRRSTLVANSGGSAEGVGGIAFGEGGTIQSTLVAYTALGAVCSGDVTWSCSNLFGNAAGDVPCGTLQGSFSTSDPLFCSPDPVGMEDVSIRADSPLANAGSCGWVGAGLVGCTLDPVAPTSWSAMKALYRD